MARLIYAEQALEDLDRRVDFVAAHDLQAAGKTADLIIEAVNILRHHPSIGRPAEHDLHELVIFRGRSGYLALYSHEDDRDTAFILALRHQSEAGYA